MRARGWDVLDGLDEISSGVLAEHAWKRALAGDLWRNASEIHAAAPMYLRKSDPELKMERKQQA
jgi:hypothetical protein